MFVKNSAESRSEISIKKIQEGGINSSDLIPFVIFSVNTILWSENGMHSIFSGEVVYK